jgi:hypothetical protein
VLLHRLAELNAMTRPARLQAAVAAVRAAAAVFHARCQAQQQRDAADDCSRVLVDGASVAGVHGWPAASTAGIGSAVPMPATGPDAFRLRPMERRGLPALSFALGERGCEFLYVQAKGPDVFPEVDIVDASCH